MKKNAIMIAGILFAAGASQAQQESSDRYRSSSPSQYDTGSALNSSETVERDARGVAVPSTSPDSSATIHDSDGSLSGQANGGNFQVSGDTDYESDHSLANESDISADSSVRGGSLDARGYNQHENDDEVEGVPHPINPGKQADSSLRGGSIYSREREWNHDSEPSSGKIEHKRPMKADSSIRGGSLEARGGREMMKERDSRATYKYSDHDLGRGDFGQGSSATWESDKAAGSVSGSANWNPSDDLLRDGMDAEAQSTLDYERDNDASVGGAARSESGSATLDDVEMNYHASGARQESDSSKVPALGADLNSSAQLEKNISGEFDIEKQGESSRRDLDRSGEFEFSSKDPNSLDTLDSSVSSSTSTDIAHDESGADLSVQSDLSADIERENQEALGGAAVSESGTSSSSDESNNTNQSIDYQSSFQSNDPALSKSDPLLEESDRGFLYRDNRARGVGSLATGEFGLGTLNDRGSMSDEQLAQELKGRLTRESAANQTLMTREAVRNIQITANDGEVTLTGTVPSERDKQMIEVAAAEMQGVKRVNNQLSVTPQADGATRDLRLGHDLEDQTSELQD
jgi:hypothetical protein